MRNYIKKIFDALLERAFDSSDDTTRLISLVELEDFTAYLVKQGITHFNDVSSIYKQMNQQIIKGCSVAQGDKRQLNNDEVLQLIEWVPLERQTVEMISIHNEISNEVVHQATKRLIEQGIFWDEDGNGPDSLVETLFADNRVASGYMYLDALRESGEDEALVASAIAISLMDALRSEDKAFLGYFRDHDHDICLMLEDHKKLERFKFDAAAKLCISGAQYLALTIGKKMSEPSSEALLMLDEHGKTEFIEACINLHDEGFGRVRPSAYLRYLTHATWWSSNVFTMPLNYSTEDVHFAFADGQATLHDELRGFPFFSYVSGHFKSSPDELIGILKLAIHEGWLDEELAIACVDNNLDNLTRRFHDITDIFRCDWLHRFNIEPFLERVNKTVIGYLKSHAVVEDIITIFHTEDLLNCLDWEELIDVVDGMMVGSTDKGRKNICDAVPLKYHKHFNSIKRYTLESDMNL
jgi:hypothetical protein